METGKLREIVKLAWSPPYHPDAQKDIQGEMVWRGSKYGNDAIKNVAREEYWYLEFRALEEAAIPIVEHLNSESKYRFDPSDIETWEALPHENLFPPDAFTFCGHVDDKSVLYVPYQALKDGGYLLHSREDYLAARTMSSAGPELSP